MQDLFRKDEKEETQGRSRHDTTIFEAVEAVGATSGIPGRQVLPTSQPGTSPCYPVCRVLAFANPTAVSLQFIMLLSLTPLHWTLSITDERRLLLSCASSSCHTDARRFVLGFTICSCHLAMNRSAASRTPQYHLPAFLSAVGHSAVLTPNTNAECYVDPSVAGMSRTVTS